MRLRTVALLLLLTMSAAAETIGLNFQQGPVVTRHEKGDITSIIVFLPGENIEEMVCVLEHAFTENENASCHSSVQRPAVPQELVKETQHGRNNGRE